MDKDRLKIFEAIEDEAEDLLYKANALLKDGKDSEALRYFHNYSILHDRLPHIKESFGDDQSDVCAILENAAAMAYPAGLAIEALERHIKTPERVCLSNIELLLSVPDKYDYDVGQVLLSLKGYFERAIERGSCLEPSAPRVVPSVMAAAAELDRRIRPIKPIEKD